MQPLSSTKLRFMGKFRTMMMSVVHKKTRCMKVIVQALVLVLSFCLVFIWHHTILAIYTIPALGILVATFLVLSFRKKEFNLTRALENQDGLSIFVLNTLIFLFIFSTGAILSPIFFLLYFLAFGISFIFDPVTVFVFVIGTVLIFLPDILKDDVTGNSIKVGSLLLICPLAFFFGRQSRQQEEDQAKREAIEERANDAADTIAGETQKVLERNKQTLKAKDVESLNEILEETESLREESTNG